MHYLFHVTQQRKIITYLVWVIVMISDFFQASRGLGLVAKIREVLFISPKICLTILLDENSDFIFIQNSEFTPNKMITWYLYTFSCSLTSTKQIQMANKGNPSEHHIRQSYCFLKPIPDSWT